MSKKKDIKMKHILIPVIVLIVALLITAFALGNPGGNSSSQSDEQGTSYHVHAEKELYFTAPFLLMNNE